jgi:hypothetical protein
MDSLSAFLGLTGSELTQLVVLGVVLFIVLFLARVALKLTATLFRIGCFGIFLILAALFVMRVIG